MLHHHKDSSVTPQGVVWLFTKKKIIETLKLRQRNVGLLNLCRIVIHHSIHHKQSKIHTVEGRDHDDSDKKEAQNCRFHV